MAKADDRHLRDVTDCIFGYVEDGFYILIAVTLALAGAILFGHQIYDFVKKLAQAPLPNNILSLLDGLLLVFILSEILHTIRAVIDEKVLLTEPFLVVGIVAGSRSASSPVSSCSWG